ncbi:MAG: CopG family antitoxin [Candidatus Shapirobacteria bacterium]
MKKIIKSKIPDFKNYEEEANFWDTHDITDFMSEMKHVKVKFNIKVPKEETIIVRLQRPMKKKMQAIADDMGLNLSAMMRMWMIEKMKTLSA